MEEQQSPKRCQKVCEVFEKINSFYERHEHTIDTLYIVTMTGLSVANIMLQPWTAAIFVPLMLLLLRRHLKKHSNNSQ